MPRYVFLFHDLPPGGDRGSHYDLMFETADGLQTWAVGHLPVAGEEAQTAVELPLHRAAYLDYEGPVSGGRGSVHRVQQGTYERTLEDSRQIRFRCRRRQSDGPTIDQLLVFDRSVERGWMLRSNDDAEPCPTSSNDAN